MNRETSDLFAKAQERAVGDIPPKGSGSGHSIEEIITKGREAYLNSLVAVSYAGHPIMPSAVEERCCYREFHAAQGASVMCGEHATHKLGEEGGNPMIHNLTSYVCCEHFRAVMGRCSL